MKSTLVLDQDAVPTAATDEQQKQIRYVPRKGCKNLVPIYPRGTEFEGQMAIDMVLRGQSHPSDDECVKACGKSEGELIALQVAYKMTHDGINSPQDRDLVMAGVILGFDENGVGIPGPQYEKYNAALKKLMKDDEDE